MFDFEKLEVYKKARDFNKVIRAKILSSSELDQPTRSQLSRAALSIMLNIAEGAGRFTKPDKRNFYVIARGSIFECVAICDFLLDDRIIASSKYDEIYGMAEEISKMLYAMIQKLEK